MLMMRLQRVGRKNDPSYRVVVVEKRTGPKSNKNISILGSYNPRLDHVTLDTEKAKEWLAKGVQPSETVHNILVNEQVIEGKKVNVLPKKSPIVDEEALKKAEAEAAAKAQAEKTEDDVAASTEADAADESAEATAPAAVSTGDTPSATDDETKV